MRGAKCPACGAPLVVPPLAVIARTTDPQIPTYPMVVAYDSPASCTDCRWTGRFRDAMVLHPPGRGRTYTTKSGRVLTDADIQALADEAERGYDIKHLKEMEER